MTAFRSRWDDWEPKEAPLRTDKADKSPSVSSVSDTPRRFDEAEGASVSTSPRPFTGGIDPSDPETGSQETPTPCTDRTDKSIPQAFNLTTDKADERSQSAHVVLLHCPPGVPEAWVQGVADLLAMSRPVSCPAERWNVLREDAYHFLRDHAAQAHELGWTEYDLLGTHRERPWVRYDCMGLVPVLDRGRVVALSDIEAVIEKPNETRLTFRRRAMVSDEVCLLWNLK